MKEAITAIFTLAMWAAVVGYLLLALGCLLGAFIRRIGR